jgi:predicted adenylyl cyclase CyaB
MSNTIEIELRYKILDQKQIVSFLAAAQRLHTKRIIDVYVDTAERILWKQGIYIRIRNDKQLDIKFNRACLQDATIQRLDHCEEHRFALPLETAKLHILNELLTNLKLKMLPIADLQILKSFNGFETHYVIDKVRTFYTYKSFTIVIDEIKDLGTFLEIELMTNNENNIEKVKYDMRAVLAGLNLEPVKSGYCELIVKKHDFDCYLQGRYVLEEDRSALHAKTN